MSKINYFYRLKVASVIQVKGRFLRMFVNFVVLRGKKKEKICEAAGKKSKTKAIASKVPSVRRKEQMKFSIVAQESGGRRRRAWGRGGGSVLMPMGGRRSAFEFLCLASIAYATWCCTPLLYSFRRSHLASRVASHYFI